ncbi:hypothetical protein ACFQ5M_01955 [Agrilactobacillus yilanensis]|uniref:DNA-packaging protein n=1 Tax=Agrilactobacillus yilanensis TaxID=2485997 RepID=A0ABW4J6L4_9LACO|nr:hypothetical protein [Agrilactobacillus yilanensis]
MAKQKISIDPNAFALAVVSGSNLKAEDDTRASKDALKRYLSAYMLIEKYNQLEDEQFKFTNSPDFEYLIKALDHVRLN